MNVFQVIQQQQLLKTDLSSVLFNPDTQTKIIYRVMYPSDGTYTRKPKLLQDSASAAENSHSDPATWGTSAKKMRRHRRTRSGRVCRPPQYMVTDYKEVHALDYETETSDIIGTGYSDVRGNSRDQNASDDHMLSKVLDLDEPIPTGE